MARLILRAPRNIPKEALYGELGWQSLDSLQNRVPYYHRVLNMHESKFITKSYQST